MSISVNSNLSRIMINIQSQTNNIRNMKSVLNIIAQDMVKEAQLNFRNSKSPTGEKWQNLSTLTINSRRGRSSKPLIDTGTLRRSLSGKATETQAIAGTNLIYAPIHQFGGVISRTRAVIPARPYFGVNPKMSTKYKKMILEHINNNT